MTSRRARKPAQHAEPTEAQVESVVEETEQKEPQTPPPPSGKVFLGEEDKRLLKRFDQYVVKKLGISANRSFKI